MPAAASAVAAVAGLLLAASSTTQVVLTMQDPTIDESSGLTVSRLHPDLLWTHNDGGSIAQVVALDAHGSSVARVTLAGIDPYDPEALAPGQDDNGRPALFLGDIGDNDAKRPDVSVFRLTEPGSLGDSTTQATWYRFTYPDGPHDAEALLVGPHGRIMIATKALSGAALYRAPRKLVTQDQGTNRLTRIAPVPAFVTDGAYLPDGRFVLRTYTSVYVYDRPGHQVGEAELPLQPQGESVAADGDRLLVGSEGVHSQVLSVPVPAAAVASSPSRSPSQPEPHRTPSPSASSSALGTGVGTSTWLLSVAGGVALFVVLAGGIAVARRRRS